MLLPGGALKAGLESSGESREGGGGGESMRGGLNPPLIRGAGGPPPENFVKSMYLRCISSHFEAHFSIFYSLNFK